MNIQMPLLAAALLLDPASPLYAEEYTPSYDRIRQRLEQPARASAFGFNRSKEDLQSEKRSRKQRAAARVRSGRRDSVWNGVLIGAAAGAGGGYVWARNVCGSNDSECFYIAGPVGVLTGAGIGAAVGGILDALSR